MTVKNALNVLRKEANNMNPLLTIIYDGENDCIRVLAKDGKVLVYTIYEFPNDFYDNDDDQLLFDWVISNHKEDILECLEALGLR